MNQAMFVGRLVRPVTLQKVGIDSKVSNNVIAVSRRFRNKNGEIPADFIPITAWNYQADVLNRFCEKGQLIAVTGKMQSRNYEDKEGNKRYIIEMLVDDVTLLGRRQSESNQNQNKNEQLKQTQNDQQSATQNQTQPTAVNEATVEEKSQYNTEAVEQAINMTVGEV